MNKALEQYPPVGRNLLAVCESLVRALKSLCPEFNVVIFVGSPPVPLAHDVSETAQKRLMEFQLSGKLEPLLVRVVERNEPHFERPKTQPENCALQQDDWAGVWPVCKGAYVYLGGPAQQHLGTQEAALVQELLSAYRPAVKDKLRSTLDQSQVERTRSMLAKAEGRASILEKAFQSAEVFARGLDEAVILEDLCRLLQKEISSRAGLVITSHGTRKEWGYRLGLLRDLAEQPPTKLVSRLADGSSLASFCLEMDGVKLGAFRLLRDPDSAFLESELKFLGLVAHQVSATLARAQLHQELVRAKKSLEESQAELLQSGKMKAVGQLGAGIAHELNTPLGAILLNLEMLEENIFSNPKIAERNIVNAKRAGVKAQQIVSRILHYSGAKGAESDFTLGEVVENALQFLSRPLELANVEPERAIRSTVSVRGKSRELQQLLINLVINSLDAMSAIPPIARRLTIEVGLEDAMLTLCVRDTGCGMDSSQLEKACEPFYTTKPIGNDRPGLGLWVAYKIATAHDGKLEIQSKVNVGTSVTLSLPAGSTSTHSASRDETARVD